MHGEIISFLFWGFGRLKINWDLLEYESISVIIHSTASTFYETGAKRTC